MIGLMQERPPYVRFEIGTIETRDAQGMPMMKDIEQIHVTPAGSKDVFVAVADEWIRQKEDQARKNQFNPAWAQQIRAAYGLWKQGVEVPENGTSIRAWPLASPAEVKRCIDANVLTVEDLAVANEQCIDRMGMGARGLKEKAKGWLAERDGPGRSVREVASLKVENEAMRERLTALEDANRRMAAQLSQRERKKTERPAITEAGDAIQ